METKKHSNLQLEKNSGLYFLMGLTAILLFIYMALEWKTYYKSDFDLASLDVTDELIEEVPLTIQNLPPPKIQVPPVIKIVPNHEKIIETIFESTESDQDREIIPVDDITVIDDPVDEVIPFTVIEDVPVFPGCENENNKRACFQEMMQKHIRKNFRYPEMAQEMRLQGRVNLVFTIQKDGSISDIKMRGPHEILEKEAARIISKLPKMTPGKQRGTPVKVPFAIPITFKLN